MNKFRIYCFPYSGGSASIYNSWKGYFGEYAEIIPLEYSGHGTRSQEPLLTDVCAMAADLADRIGEDAILFGYSLGSVVALETARLLTRLGRKPLALIGAAQRPPHLLHRDGRLVFENREQAMEHIIELGQLPSEILNDKELYEYFSEIIYADMLACQGCRSRKSTDSLDMPVQVFFGSDDKETPRGDMAEFLCYSNGNFRMTEVSGGHFFAFESFDEFAPEMAAFIRSLAAPKADELIDADLSSLGDAAHINRDFSRLNGGVIGRRTVSAAIDPETERVAAALCADKNISRDELYCAVLQIVLSRYGINERTAVTVVDAEGRCAVNIQKLEKTVSAAEVIGSVSATVHGGFVGAEQLHNAIAQQCGSETDGLPGAAYVVCADDHITEKLAAYDFLLSCRHTADGVCLTADYNTEYFREETISGILEHYICILRQVAADTSVRIEDIMTCTEAEAQMIFCDFNNTAVPYPSELTVSQIFERQTEATPDATALVGQGKRYSYAQLNRRANMLAAKLREEGFSRGDRAAIVTQRSVEIIVCILAVVKAGGSLVWVDPVFPGNRKEFIINDCGAKLILSGVLTRECREEIASFAVPSIDAMDEGNYIGSGENLPCVNTPDDPMYMLYTSGTTGRPKGVISPHTGISYYCCSERDGLIGGCLRREYGAFLSVTTPSYGVFYSEIFLPLLNGMKLVMPTEDEVFSVREMERITREENAGCFSTTPSRLRMYMSTDACAGFLSQIKMMILAGERLGGDIYYEIRRYSECRIFNGFGASEISQYAAEHELDGKEGNQVPIGRPLDNICLYIVDSKMRPVGIGVPGELCVCSPGIVKGYINNPELTAQKFVKNPFGDGRIYHTGDMARWRKDGQIECVGRRDGQIKIRGMRVELGEIETVLRKLDGVTNAAVLVRKHNGEDSICAFYTSAREITPDWVRNELKKTLARHMIPTFIMHLESFPLNQNGKLDNEQLRKINVATAVHHAAPENETERILIELFRDTLSVTDVGATDDFFALGGHSLRAVHLINLIFERFGCTVSVNDIFARPTVRELSAIIVDSNEFAHIPQCEPGEVYPVSSAQKRLYLINAHNTESIGYNVPVLLKIKGALSCERLRSAFETLAARHESLRTGFEMMGDEIVQRIHPTVTIPFKHEERIGESDIDALFRGFVRPFDFTVPPLMRVKAVQTAADEWYVMIDSHHIIIDGKSSNLMNEELFRIYDGDMPEPNRLHYRDYSEWMRTRDLSAQSVFWKELFDEEAPVPDMPTDFPRTRFASDNSAETRLVIGRELHERITEVCARLEITEYMFWLASAMILLSRYSRQEDIVIGSPVSGRTHRDTERMLGMFVNTLAMRGRPKASKTFTDFAAEIREMCLTAYENQEYPFDELVDSLELEANLSRNPLFDVMLVLQNNEAPDLYTDELRIVQSEAMQGTSGLDLCFEIVEGADGRELRTKYCTDLFKKETAEGISAHFCALLESIAENPDRKLSELEMLSEEERQKVLCDFNDTAVEYPKDKTLVELFEEQVEKTPDNIAIVFEDEQLTYAEFNARANSLAHRLREMGVKPDDFVAIIAERSIEMLCGIFGVLKAGGAYVPIDPTYPQDRVEFMLSDCAPKAVLVYKAEKLTTDIPVIDLAQSEVFAGAPENPKRINKPTDAAYCIYTSGTTGKPKGVVIEHQGVVNLGDFYINEHKVDENDKVLMFASFVFDASITEIMTSLLSGASLHIASSELRGDTIRLAEYIEHKGITIALLPPVLLSNIEIKGLRAIITAGSETNRRLVEQNRHIPVYSNDYGPTEATVCATFWKHNSEEGVPDRVPIGKPINNKKIHIMNGDTLCGIGVPGELCIAGDGLARGYLNRPELTAERFVANPFGEGRMYRTGDLARWLPDGNIEYLGRIDDQVKIRGFRIELGEIESRLRELENVCDCAVIARDDASGEKAIFAYIVSDEQISVSDIRDTLGQSLPEYMIPAYMMQIDAVPVTRNGKLDRRALPEIEQKSDKAYIAPRNDVERIICEVFADVLGVGQVGINDSFFALGGDSIKSIRIVSKVRALGCELSVKDIMSRITPKSIAVAAKLTEAAKYEQGEVVGAITDTPIIEHFRAWNFPVPEHFNQAMLFDVDADADTAEKALREIVKHHDMLRAVMRDGRLFVLNSAQSRLCDFETLDITGIEDAREKVEAECTRIQSGTDLEHGPLVRALFITNGSENKLMVCIHHFAVDGVSWRILQEDFAAALGQIKEGGEVRLAEKTASYKEWSEALAQYRESAELAKEKPYWDAVMSKAADGRLLADDATGLHGVGYAVAETDTETTALLLTDAESAYNTRINDLLLAALGLTVRQYSGQDIVTVSMEGHGREPIHREMAIDRTVGWFTNVYPVILECSDDVRDSIISTKEMLRRIPNNGMGCGCIYGAAGEAADICFNYLGEIELGNDGECELPTGQWSSERNVIPTAVTFNLNIKDGRLVIGGVFSRARFTEEHMEEMVRLFAENIRRVAEHCIGLTEKVKTASDFGAYCKLDTADYEAIVSELGGVHDRIEKIYPLTPLQEGMLFHTGYGEENTEYVVQQCLQISDPFDKDKFAQATELLSLKHEVFRTRFIYRNTSRPYQVVLSDGKIEFIDLKAKPLTDDKRQEEYYAFAAADVDRGFDLENESPARISVYTPGDGINKIIFTVHHIIADGWSMHIMVGDLSEYYSRLLRGCCYEDIRDEIINKRLGCVGYSDYVKSIYERNAETALSYWAGLLDGYDEAAVIPSLAGASCSERGKKNLIRRFDCALAEKLAKLAERSNVTINTVTEAAWGILLHRYNRTDDAVFGKVVSGRNVELDGIENMVGMFINTIPVRVCADADTSVFELLAELQRQSIESGEYDCFALSDIQAQTAQRSELIKTLYAFENYYKGENNTENSNDNIAFKTDSIRDETNYDISVSFFETGGSLEVSLTYEGSEYSSTEMELLITRLESILEAIAANPEQRLSDIETLSEEERQKILFDFNDTAADYPKDKTIVELFEEQVEKTPDNIAVVFEDEQLTYAQLNARANSLAHKLREMGVRPDDFVAMLTERSLEMIVGIYGILKAGGAYVPINTIYPKDRIQYILEDCRPKALLTYKAEIETDIPEIDLANSEVRYGMPKNPPRVNGAGDLAYCIYTSGTTGKPKGVLVEHRNVVRLMFNDKFEFSFDSNDVWTMFHSYGFDFSVWELYGATLYGGKLVVLPSSAAQDGKLLMEELKRHRVTVLNQVPTSFYNLLKYDYSGNKLFLRYLIFGGEALAPSRLKEWHVLHPECKIVNMYGITETTVHVTYRDIDSIEIERGVSDIGSAIPTLKVYILNGMQLCGIGVPGELCVVGDGLARGYLNRPKLTAEKFVQNPFGAGRMYRAGDLARWLPDGNIEYLGRIDQQVKIRGFRIELGEIESKIREIEAVRDCAVIARADASGDKAIFAYIVSDEAISVSDIRDTLGQSLPDYMIPAYMMQIDAIPVTRNGKLDRRALPEIEQKSEKEYIAPRNETEQIICDIFSEILSVERVGVHDSFFDLGGHSLRATRLVNRIEAETGHCIPLKQIFGNPTPEKLSALVTESRAAEYIPIPKAGKQKYYPMSSTQKRTYLICQMDADGVAYNMPQMLRLTGEVRPDDIRNALQTIIDRHDILRTRFLTVDGEPMQQILDSIEADYEYIEDAATNEQELANSFVQPFDLESAQLVRARLVKREACHILMLDMHHIVCDGMSMGTFLDEFCAAYNGEALAPLTHQYVDYSEWMRSRDLSAQKAYWVSQFEDEIPVLDMPTDFTRPQEQSYKGDIVYTETSRTLCENIKALAKQTGATEYMIFLAAAMVLLSKYSRQDDIVIGSPISGRTHRDTEQMLGMFINTLAMRGRPEGGKTFAQFLSEIKEACLKGYEHQEYPFEELVEAIDVQRDFSRNPLFDVMLVMQNNEQTEIQLNGAKAERFFADCTVAKFDLTFDIAESNDRYGFQLEYCTDLFRRETAENISAHFSAVLESITKNPERKLSELEMLSEEERQKLLVDFNNTAADYPKDKTIVDLFEEQVEKTPDSIAVVFEDEQLTYAQLNARVNSLAHKLREMGVQPDDFVAIIAERSIEMLCAIYGVLKAGGAYVPIDPAYPDERIEFMLSDCAPKAVLTYRAEIETNIPVIDLAQSEVFAGAPENPRHVGKPTDAVYCIYTSGTTGKPKGVVITNRNIINRLVCIKERFELDGSDVVLQKASFAFDVSVWEIMGAGIAGACCVLLEKDGEMSAQVLYQTICRYNVTICDFSPAVLSEFLTYLNDKQLSVPQQLRYVTVGSEKVGTDIAAAFLKMSGGEIRLINQYGPTEAAIDVTYFDCSDYNGTISLPIGKPISNTQIYMLDGDALCSIGVPGELCIAGDGLARGYLNRPELTAEKFVPNPFGEGRMYRTGDLARWLPDGNIEYLGRIDDQVKIRGFRIELGEIESRIREIENVKDCAVIARDDASGEKAIFAYVVSDEEISVSHIRDTLGQSLPEHMIPAYMMQIEAIPVTRNGKLDRRALPEIEQKSGKEYIAPRNETEQIICDIFSEILSVERVGVNDSFFELGGHSLRATRLVNQIESKTGHRIALKHVFSNATPEKLAALATGSKAEEYIPIPTAEEKECYDMTAVQKSLYIIQSSEPQSLAYNMPSMIAVDNIDRRRLEDAFRKLIQRHEALRTGFTELDGRYCQNIRQQVDFTVEDCSLETFVRPFDLGRPPLMRAALTHVDGQQYLLVDTHHIISDGAAAAVLMDELDALYRGEELSAPALRHRDFTEWMNSRDFSAMEKYWTEKLSGFETFAEIKPDFSRPRTRSYEGNTVETMLGEPRSARLRALCADSGVTEFMLLMSVLMILLSRYGEDENVSVGTQLAARVRPETERLLGMLNNTVVFREKVTKYISFRRLLECVRTASLEAFENQEYPYDLLCEQLGGTREQGRTALFDIMFVYQNNETAALSFGSEQEASDTHRLYELPAKFDLSVHAYDRSGSYGMSFNYCTALFSEQTVRSFAEHYVHILDSILDNQDITVSDIQLCTEGERELIINTFNDTAAPYCSEQTLSQIFEAQAAKTPTADAVVFDGRRLTYGELNRRANMLAQTLRSKGMTRGSYAAIITDRSIELIVSMYAVLKAGGSYVWIDPAFPTQRKHFLLSDCAAKYILQGIVSDSVRSELAGLGIPVVDVLSEDSYSGSGENLPCCNTPDDVVYNLYTSGTTGVPKGVMITNRGVAYYCTSMRDGEIGRCIRPEYGSFVSVTTPSYAIFANESYIPLSNGMKVIMATEDEKNSAEKMNRLMLRENAGCINTTPSRLRSYLSSDSCDFMKQLRLIMLAGEKLTGDMLLEIRRHSPDCRVINGYGASESSMHSALYELNGTEGSSIPLGSPTDNVKLYVVDSKMRLVGVGVPGELCIGGPGVAKGYVGNEQLTAEKFIENPFADGRLYRTGDMARWRHDGNIEGLGRRDSQVKIRGIRVEPGEIESAMRKLEGIGNAAILVREIGGESFICAFYSGDEQLTSESIRESLQQVLAAHMIPTFITRLESFPLNQNGKLDYDLLRTVELETGTAYVAPEGEQEKALAEIFSEILGIERVGALDDFFAIGGHSLRAVRLINAIHDRLGFSVSISDIFEASSVRRLAKKLRHSTAVTAIPKAKEKPEYELSSAQRLIYMHSQTAENPVLYNVPYLYEFCGTIDPQKAEDAFAKMIALHESLRTRYVIGRNGLVQIIDEARKPAFEFEETDSDIEAVFERFIKPFELGEQAPIRMKAVVSRGRSYLLFDGHHIIFDGTSHENFINEWMQLYCGGTPEPLVIQYRDYCEWTNARSMEEDKNYWTEKLSRRITPVTLPYRQPRPSHMDHLGDHITIAAPVREAVSAVAAKTGATEFMVMLAAFMLLLRQYSSQDDITVGTMLAGRDLPGTERLIGMIANTVLLRADASGSKTLAQLISEMKTEVLGALRHQSYPIDMLTDDLGIIAEPSRNPLFDIMFIFHNEAADTGTNRTEGLLRQLDYGEQGSKYDLTVECDIAPDGYYLRAEYATALFERQSVQQLLEHFRVLLENIGSTLECTLSEIEMLSEEERQQVLVEFNDTAADYPRCKTIVDLFEEQVEKTPDNIAVVFEDEQLTYAEFNARVNSLAHKLRELGVGPDDFVAIIAERSTEMLCGIYGVLKAGGAYVPIDPAYPDDRIEFMLSDCAPKAVLTFKAEITTDIPTIDLSYSEVWSGAPENPERVNKPDDAAYCIYTSGTTGKPKGVAVMHRNVLNYSADTPYSVLRPAFEQKLRTVVSVTNLTFDIHVTELIVPLLHGMTTIIANRSQQENAIAFARLMEKQPADILQTTPGRIKMWLGSGGERDCLGCLKYIMLGGEAVDRQLVSSVRSCSDALIADVYGPSETTVWSTVWLIPDELPDEISIGTPITNTQICIISPTGKLCGIGIPGELCIAGDGVAVGYINRDALTAEKFVTNPFGEGRMYRTGDLAMWNADGTLRFLGRFDDQVKINGNRVELGEIECALRTLDGINDAAVTVNASGEQTLLCAYVVAEGKVDFDSVRAELARTLPTHMLPSRYMQIDTMPLSPSGKTAKKLLPAITGTTERRFIEPRTENELLLVELLGELLGLERISLNDNFFELGGNSMKAVALMTRLERMGIVTTMRDIRKSSDIARLAKRLRRI